jgi:hypothetical protein
MEASTPSRTPLGRPISFGPEIFLHSQRAVQGDDRTDRHRGLLETQIIAVFSGRLIGNHRPDTLKTRRNTPMNKQHLEFSAVLTAKEAGARLKVSLSWLAKARMRGVRVSAGPRTLRSC